MARRLLNLNLVAGISVLCLVAATASAGSLESARESLKALNENLKQELEQQSNELASVSESLREVRERLSGVETKLSSGTANVPFKNCRASAEELDQLKKVEHSLEKQVKGLRSVYQEQVKQVQKVDKLVAAEERETNELQFQLGDKQAKLERAMLDRDDTRTEAEKNIAEFKECAKYRVGAQLKALSDWDQAWQGPRSA